MAAALIITLIATNWVAVIAFMMAHHKSKALMTKLIDEKIKNNKTSVKGDYWS